MPAQQHTAMPNAGQPCALEPSDCRRGKWRRLRAKILAALSVRPNKEEGWGKARRVRHQCSEERCLVAGLQVRQKEVFLQVVVGHAKLGVDERDLNFERVVEERG